MSNTGWVASASRLPLERDSTRPEAHNGPDANVAGVGPVLQPGESGRSSNERAGWRCRRWNSGKRGNLPAAPKYQLSANEFVSGKWGLNFGGNTSCVRGYFASAAVLRDRVNTHTAGSTKKILVATGVEQFRLEAVSMSTRAWREDQVEDDQSGAGFSTSSTCSKRRDDLTIAEREVCIDEVQNIQELADAIIAFGAGFKLYW